MRSTRWVLEAVQPPGDEPFARSRSRSLARSLALRRAGAAHRRFLWGEPRRAASLPAHPRARPLTRSRRFVRQDNFLEWEYLLIGADDTVYAGGVYHGRVRFTKEYPFKPPSIMMTTPNGRFEINKRLCLSISDFHPETWNPLWSVSTILLGISSFFYEDANTAGALVGVGDAEKRALARKSFEYNMDAATGPKNFQSNFKSFIDAWREAKEKEERGGGKGERGREREDGVGSDARNDGSAADDGNIVGAADDGKAHGDGNAAGERVNANTITLGILCAAIVVAVIAVNVAARSS